MKRPLGVTMVGEDSFLMSLLRYPDGYDHILHLSRNINLFNSAPVVHSWDKTALIPLDPDSERGFPTLWQHLKRHSISSAVFHECQGSLKAILLVILVHCSLTTFCLSGNARPASGAKHMRRCYSLWICSLTVQVAQPIPSLATGSTSVVEPVQEDCVLEESGAFLPDAAAGRTHLVCHQHGHQGKAYLDTCAGRAL